IEPFDLDWTPNITGASGRRYRFGAQPQVAHWNLAQLARALAPLAEDLEPLRASINRYPDLISTHYRNTMLRKLGLDARDDLAGVDDDLLTQLGAMLSDVETDMTLFFRQLAKVRRADLDGAYDTLSGAYYGTLSTPQRTALDSWLRDYAARCAQVGLDDADRAARMNAINPLYVPRNYLVQEVIEATEAGDRAELPALLDVLRRPYDEQPGRERYAQKRPDWAKAKPGCSMLSCSS
ncbi:MAG TPA: protein adenylyltransferase SelO family protein, partial [Kofleriaceae bacterium]|nr:protein adenylyltransferase SelO family protein [Kofleriaceae bacterium]